METFRDIEACRSALEWRRSTRSIGLVATMGNVHAGHLAMIKACRSQSEITVVSTYVNPLRFRSDDAFLDYPRQLDADTHVLEASAVDVLFAPRDEELFPGGVQNAIRLVPVHAANGEEELDAAAKLTVILKMLNILRPDQLYVGEKDYAFCVLLDRLVAQFAVETDVRRVPIHREEDGVAAGDELARLTAEQRASAPILKQTLDDLAYAIRHGARNYRKLEQTGRVALRGGGFEVEHLLVQDADTLDTPGERCRNLRVVARARLGMAVLNDNIGIAL